MTILEPIIFPVRAGKAQYLVNDASDRSVLFVSVRYRIFEDAAQKQIVRMLNSHADLIKALEAATAYVETFTGNGCQQQPDPKYVRPNGDFDPELIAADAREILKKAKGRR